MATPTKTPTKTPVKSVNGTRGPNSIGYIRGIDADTHFNVRVQSGLLKRARAYAKKAGSKVSVGHVFRVALAEFMDRHPDPTKVKW